MPDYALIDGKTFVAASGRVRILGNLLETRKFQPPSFDRPAEQAYATGSEFPVAIIRGPVSYGTLKFTVALPVALRWMNDLDLWLNAELSGTITYTERDQVAAVDVTGAYITKAEVSESEAATAGEVVVAVEAQPRAVFYNGKRGGA